MKKFLYAVLGLLIVLILALYSILFTSFGNNFVKNIAEKKLNEALNVPVKIEEFQLGISDINLVVLINSMLEAKLMGDLSLFSQKINADFNITGKNLELLDIKDPLEIGGSIKGKFSDFVIAGRGMIFTSALSMDASVKDYFPSLLDIKANKLDIEKLSKIAGFDYASGYLDINANAKEFNKDDFDAKAMIDIDAKLRLKPSVAKDFGIDISRFGDILLSSNSTFSAGKITPNLKISSNILNLNAEFEPVELKSPVIKAKMKAHASELAFINPQLNSDLNADIDIFYQDKKADIKASLSGKNLSSKQLLINATSENIDIKADLQANAALLRMPAGELINLLANAKITKGELSNANLKGLLLGANTDANINQNKLNANIKGLKTLALFKLLKIEPMMDASANALINLDNYKTLKGSANIELAGKTLPAYFKKHYNYAIDSNLKAQSQIALAGADNISFNALLNSDLINTLKADGTYKKAKINAKYSASTHLANFNKLLNKKMSGDLAVNGELAIDKSINATLNSAEFFGGSLNARLLNDDFSAKLAGVSLESLAKSLDFVDIYRAKVSADLAYNLKSAQGKITANVGEGHLKPNKSINLINAILNTDITKIIFDKGDALININKNMMNYQANLQAKNASLNVADGTYNTLSKAVNAPLTLNLNGNEFKGRLVGTSDKLKYQPDAKNTISNILKIADKLSGGGDEAAPDGEAKQPQPKDPVKSLLKGIFGGKK